MIAIAHRTKPYLLLSVKLLILGATFTFIYTKVNGFDERVFAELPYLFHLQQIEYLVLFVGLAVSNWVLEIIKWQTIITPVKKITFQEAAKQTLASLMVSLATPNRIGEYGAKTCYFEKKAWKQVALLNFVGNSGQMLITLIFGGVGLFILIMNYQLTLSPIKITTMVLIGLGLLSVGYYFKGKHWLIQGLSINNVINYITKLDPKIKLQVLLLSLLRYMCFSYLFVQLVWFFGSDIPFWEAYPLVISMYVLSSFIPTLFVFDVVVKGGIALWLFSLAGVPELTILSTVIAMWLLNFVLPSLIGSYYVATFKTGEL